jgi:hypothetical protein
MNLASLASTKFQSTQCVYAVLLTVPSTHLLLPSSIAAAAGRCGALV